MAIVFEAIEAFFLNNPVVTSLVLLGGLGAVFGLLLAYAAKKFSVQTDPRVVEIAGVLPGANCGACGLPGCQGAAEAIAAGKIAINACPVGKEAVANKIAAIMGIEAEAGEQRRAAVLCAGGREECPDRFTYVGLKDCAAAHRLAGGPKACEYGCLGLGSCAVKCPFGAIRIDKRGLAEIGPECTGCGLCVNACPRGLITLVPAAGDAVAVACRNKQRGADIRKICKTGCIACGICAKNCPENAITVDANLAVIDRDKCTHCGACIAKCPTKCIVKIGAGHKTAL